MNVSLFHQKIRGQHTARVPPSASGAGGSDAPAAAALAAVERVVLVIGFCLKYIEIEKKNWERVARLVGRRK